MGSSPCHTASRPQEHCQQPAFLLDCQGLQNAWELGIIAPVDALPASLLTPSQVLLGYKRHLKNFFTSAATFTEPRSAIFTRTKTGDGSTNTLEF